MFIFAIICDAKVTRAKMIVIGIVFKTIKILQPVLFEFSN